MPITTSKSKNLTPTIKVEDVKRWYEDARKEVVASANTDNRIDALANVQPDWEHCMADFSQLNREFLIVPVSNARARRGGLKIVATRDTLGRVIGNLVLFFADSAYHKRSNGNYRLSNYTGSVLYFNPQGQYEQGVYLKEGRLSGRTEVSSRVGTQALGIRECEETVVTSVETVYTGASGTDGACDGCTAETRIVTRTYTHCSNFGSIIQNNLNNIFGASGFDINNYNNNGGASSNGSGTVTNPNPTYQSSFVDPSILYSGSLPASLLNTDQVTAQYDRYLAEYMQYGHFSEGEFNNMYWNTNLFKQVDGFLSVSKTNEFWLITKEHYDFYQASSRYRALNNNFGEPKGRLLEFLRLYKKNGRTKNNLLDDFEQVVSNTALKNHLDTYLNQRLGDFEAWDNVIEVVREFKNENYTADATFAQDVQLYLRLLEESPEFAEVANSLNALSGIGSGNNPMKNTLLDLLVEGAQEWAENFLGINDLSLLRDLLERATENAQKIAFKATRIIARFIAKKNPIFNALNSMWKAKEVYQKIDKVYKLYDKLNNFSPKCLEKIAEALKKIGNKNLLKRFTDTQDSNSSLAGHYNIDLTDSAVDAFLNALSEAFGVPWDNGNDMLSTQNRPGAKHMKLRPNQGAANAIPGLRYFEHYPRSSSTQEPSIEIVINMRSFKFRLD